MTQPKYKIWDELKEQEENFARKSDLKYLEKQGKKEKNKHNQTFHFLRPCGARQQKKRKHPGCGKKFKPRSKGQTLCDKCYAEARQQINKANKERGKSKK